MLSSQYQQYSFLQIAVLACEETRQRLETTCSCVFPGKAVATSGSPEAATRKDHDRKEYWRFDVRSGIGICAAVVSQKRVVE
jgi:hypothetical protein